MTILLAVQLTVLAAVRVVYGAPQEELVLFAVALVVLHVIAGTALTFLRDLFSNVESGEHYDRVNAANVLSLVRVSSAPTVLVLLLLAGRYPVVPLLAPLVGVVFLTDLLDGQVSRRTGQVTRIGQYLDSTSDYLILFVVAIALKHYALIAPWLFWIVIARFGWHAVAQIAIFLLQRMQIEFRSSFLGKASVFATMTLFALSLLELVPAIPAWYVHAFVIAEYITAALVAVSLVEKVMEFVERIRAL